MYYTTTFKRDIGLSLFLFLTANNNIKMKTIIFNNQLHHNVGANYRRVLMAIASSIIVFEQALDHPNRGFKKTSPTKATVKVVFWTAHNMYFFTIEGASGINLYFYMTLTQFASIVGDLIILEDMLCGSTI